MSTRERVYWDSSCFLSYFMDESGRAEKCLWALERAGRGEVLIVTSALTLAEVLWVRGGPRIPQKKAESIQIFFHRRSYIGVHDLTRKIAEAARRHVWDNNIKPKDAIHVATAVQFGTEALETFDEGLIRKSGKVGGHPLLIREPEEPAQGSLALPPKTRR